MYNERAVGEKRTRTNVACIGAAMWEYKKGICVSVSSFLTLMYVRKYDIFLALIVRWVCWFQKGWLLGSQQGRVQVWVCFACDSLGSPPKEAIMVLSAWHFLLPSLLDVREE
jgi:hypothetical protein